MKAIYARKGLKSLSPEGIALLRGVGIGCNTVCPAFFQELMRATVGVFSEISKETVSVDLYAISFFAPVFSKLGEVPYGAIALGVSDYGYKA